jgi:uncharacterized protein GlcG (DUF336 family)
MSLITQRPTLTLNGAKLIAQGCYQFAQENNWNVVIAVVDDGL